MTYGVPSVDYGICIILWPTTHKFDYHVIGFQFGSHVAQIVPGFNQLDSVSRLDEKTESVSQYNAFSCSLSRCWYRCILAPRVT